jgi:hypothetical protein
VGLDDKGRARYVTSVPDPLTIRAEFPDSSGHLHGQIVERPGAEIIARVPNDIDIGEVRFFRPVGRALDLIASYALNR